MKKIFLLFTLLSAFIILSNKNINAAEYNVLFNDQTINSKESIILGSGYYILNTYEPEDGLEDMLLGDFEVSLFTTDSALTTSTCKSKFNYSSAYDSAFTAMVANFNQTYGTYYPDTVIIFLKVNTYAVIYNNQPYDVNHVIANYISTSEVNTNASISGNMTHVVDYDNKLTLAQIKTRYSATDNVDGNITSRLQFKSNYDEASAKVGKYYIIAEVSDSAGHKVTTADYIIVIDSTAPTITLSQTTKTIEVKTAFTSDDIYKLFTISDNVDSVSQLKVTKFDNFKSQYNKLGTYEYYITAVDKSGNSTTSEKFTINVVDKTKPVITLTAGGDLITADHVLSEAEIIALMTVSDNYYTISNDKIEIVNNTCSGVQGQEYQITVRVKDGSDNYGEATFRYYLSDTESPVIFVEKTLYIPYGTNYTNAQIINMLKEAGIISSDAVSISQTFVESKEDGEVFELYYHELLEDGSINEGKLTLNYFHPVKPANANTFNYWYFLLLIIPIVFITFLVIIKKTKHVR